MAGSTLLSKRTPIEEEEITAGGVGVVGVGRHTNMELVGNKMRRRSSTGSTSVTMTGDVVCTNLDTTLPLDESNNDGSDTSAGGGLVVGEAEPICERDRSTASSSSSFPPSVSSGGVVHDDDDDQYSSSSWGEQELLIHKDNGNNNHNQSSGKKSTTSKKNPKTKTTTPTSRTKKISKNDNDHDHDDNKKDKVSFSKIHIREYPIIIGDNPSIMTGVPITIDWVHVSEIKFTIDEYEDFKPESRTMAQLRMPSSCRNGILQRQGFSTAEIRRGLRMANITKGQRRKTIEGESLSSVQETAERIKRATLNATFRRKQKAKERQLLSQFQKS